MDPDPAFQVIRIQGFEAQKLKRNTAETCFKIFFWSKIAIYLYLDLYKRRPSYRRSLQHLKKLNLVTFLHFCGSFLFSLYPDPDPGPHWFRIRIHNIAHNTFVTCPLYFCWCFGFWGVLHHVPGYSDLWTGEACRKQPVFKAPAPSETVQSRDTQLEDEEVVVKARKDSLKGIV